MLRKFVPRRIYPLYITAIAPFSFIDTIKILTPALTIGIIVSIFMWDPSVLLLSIGLGYFCIILIGRHFVRWMLDLYSSEDVMILEKLLDDTKTLQRKGSSFKWTRRTWRLFESTSDEISIEENGSKWIVRGRKHDIFSLAAALNDSAGFRSQN